MPDNNSILKMLNLKDRNIKFEEVFCEEKIIKEKGSLIIHAYLDTSPTNCPHCGKEYKDNIVVHGYYKRKIVLPPVSNLNTYLDLKVKRYKCKCCSKTFSQKTSIVEENCFVSKNTKISIALDAQENISEKAIAFKNNVSHSTCSRVINSFYELYEINSDYLPEVLSFDEFKSVKASSGAMSFIFADPKNKTIIDILEDRRLYKLKEYFNRYPKKTRDKVSKIVIDMYSPYISLIKSHFKKAEIIFDRFHIVQLVNRELNKCRIFIMKDFNTSSKEYKILKKYYKLLLKSESDLDSIHFSKRVGFGEWKSDKSIVEYMLSLNDMLKNTYEVYQGILSAIHGKDTELLEKIVLGNNKNIFEGMEKSLKTLKKYKDYVKNALKYEYSNAYIEGINNKTKVIKRTAYGYRSFLNFRNRILIANNLIRLKASRQ